MTVILFLIILAVLILVHELGHFTAAKLFGVKVEEFGLGFPPKLFAKKIGETTYTLNAIPFGGFVKIFGENYEEIISQESLVNSEETDKEKKSFAHKPKWVQAIILLAGIFMNIVFGWLLISTGYIIGLPTPVDSGQSGTISNVHLTITSVLPNSPADKAGLASGDTIMSISAHGSTLENLSPQSVSDLIAMSQTPVTMTYEKGDNATHHTISITPSTTIVPGREAVGITMDMVGILQLPVGQALVQGGVMTLQLLKEIVVGLWQFLVGLVTFHSDLSQVSGPVGIARVVGQANSIGFVYLMSLVALISINLAVINLIPFPALDGGRLLFVAIEAVTRRKINTKFATWVNGVGFALLIILMLVVTAHDIFNIL